MHVHTRQDALTIRTVCHHFRWFRWCAAVVCVMLPPGVSRWHERHFLQNKCLKLKHCIYTFSFKSTSRHIRINKRLGLYRQYIRVASPATIIIIIIYITSIALKSSGARDQKRNKTKSLIIFKCQGHTGVIISLRSASYLRWKRRRQTPPSSGQGGALPRLRRLPRMGKNKQCCAVPLRFSHWVTGLANKECTSRSIMPSQTSPLNTVHIRTLSKCFSFCK